MASQVEICNISQTILGKPGISALSDGSPAALVYTTIYDNIRRALISGRATWRFAFKRASLPALVGAPISGPYTTRYQLPADCLKIMQIGDTWPGLDLSDFRLGPTDADYTQEGNILLCDYGAPLSLGYMWDVTDTTLFHPWFVIYFAADMAWTACERITGSDAKQAAAKDRRTMALSEAAASNALLNPPIHAADDTWIAARMQ